MWRSTALRLLTIVSFLLLLTGCGGGGGSDDEPSSDWDEMVWDEGDWA